MIRSRSYPKAARIRRRRQFLELQRSGTRRHTAHFVVIRAPSPGPTTRLGVTVSAKVGNAVARNRTKRLVREVFRARRALIEPPADIVVIAKPGANNLNYAQAASQLDRALGFDRPT